MGQIVAGVKWGRWGEDKLGLVYVVGAVRLRDRQAAIGVGMTVQAEIRTNRRRVIDYLLSPIARTVDEAGRER